MKFSKLLKAAVCPAGMLAASMFIFGTETAVQANTPRGDSGLSFGSEVVGSHAPDLPGGAVAGAGGTAAATLELQRLAQGSTTTAGQALQAFNTGAKVFDMQTAQNCIKIQMNVPEVASAQPVSLTGPTDIAFAMDNGQGVQVQKTFQAANLQTAAQVSSLLAGVSQGLIDLNVSPTRAEQTLAMATQLGMIPQADALASPQLTSQMVLLASLMDQLPMGQLSADKVVVLRDSIKAYNQLVDTASPEVVVALSQQPEFQAIEQQLRGLRAAAGDKMMMAKSMSEGMELSESREVAMTDSSSAAAPSCVIASAQPVAAPVESVAPAREETLVEPQPAKVEQPANIQTLPQLW